MLKVSDLDLTKQVDWSKAIPVEDSYAAEREDIDPDDYQGWESVEYVMYSWEDWEPGDFYAQIALLRDPTNPGNVAVVYSDDYITDVDTWDSFISWCKEDSMGESEAKVVALLRANHENPPFDPDECIVLAHRLS